MAEQKPMSTNDTTQLDADRQRRSAEAREKMKERPELGDRIRTAHPNMIENDDALTAALADFERLEKENPAQVTGQEQRPA